MPLTSGASDDRPDRFRDMVLPLLAYLNRLAIALTGDRERAEDLVQESVMRGLRYFGSFQGGDFRAWMATIMRNLCRDARMRAPLAADAEALEDVADPSLTPEQMLARRDQDARLRALVASLPDSLRETLVLREFAELSYAQIAAALNLPLGTVMSRLSRARESLRVSWIADGNESRHDLSRRG